MKSRFFLLQSILIFLLISVGFGTGLLSALLNNDLVDLSVLEHYNPGKPTILLDCHGKEWARFEMDKREFVPLKNIPPLLQQAFLAAEDRNFFQHGGISVRGIIRSLVINIISGRIVQGASTITQQLVKLLFLDSRQVFSRKIKEQLLSLVVERQFTKEKILETYLNHVYFGCGIYGVAAAAKRFWGKSVVDLTVAEMATLAGVLKSPAKYCPVLCPLSSVRRRNIVLGSMLSMGVITQEEYEQALAVELATTSEKAACLAPHLKETIRGILEDKFGKELLYQGGLTVKTTIDSEVQSEAEKQFKKKVLSLRSELPATVDGALLSVATKTGEIRALVGGVDFALSQFNRALQARRQMGSVIKPIIYAAAIEQGRKFTEVEIDEPVEIIFQGQTWCPRNNTRSFEGQMTLARALSYSNNVITIKTLIATGCHKGAALVQKFHLGNTISSYPSLALGCIDVTLKQVVGAFNVFANNGVYVEPHFMVWIKDEWGKRLWQQPKQVEERLLDPRVCGQVTKVLGIGIKRFLGIMKKNTFLPEGIGKTGTTNDSRTCWFVGATPELTTGLYIGCDDNRSLGKNIYPVWNAFPIWLHLYEKVANTHGKFHYDPSLVPIKINWVTGQQVGEQYSNVVELLV